jgi:GTP-binding protein EngB required for normal cell division
MTVFITSGYSISLARATGGSMTDRVRVLVFGATGVGKTSVCNTLTQGSRPTDSGPRGVTSKTHVYKSFKHQGRSIELVDTAGLHEAASGTVPTEQAAMQLVELLSHSKDGFTLLVHVARAGRITKQFEDDHEFFVRRMTDGKIPVVLVLTGCENEDPMQEWIYKHGKHFAHLQYKDAIPSCYARGGKLEKHFAPLREQSRMALLDSIVSRALPSPVLLYGNGTSITLPQLVAKLWNDFVDITGLPEKYRAKVNESAYQLLRRVGVPKSLADAAIAHIPDLVEEVVGKFTMPWIGKTAKAAVRKLLERVLAKPA